MARTGYRPCGYSEQAREADGAVLRPGKGKGADAAVRDEGMSVSAQGEFLDRMEEEALKEMGMQELNASASVRA